MTIDKAIEYLGVMLDNYDSACPFDEVDAIKLGIEALKEFKYARERGYISKILLLPGETT